MNTDLNWRYALVLVLSFAVSLGVVTSVRAADGNPATNSNPVPWFGGGPGASPEGAVSCFDYYHFGSVQVDLSPETSTIVPGKALTFQGTIKNANSYPIVDGQVYVKIFKKSGVTDAQVKENGYPVVDFFLAKDAIALTASADQPLTFNWAVPKEAQGDYQAVFYFTSAHRYNLLGLSFTDDVVGNKANFSIVNKTVTESPVVFDKNSITLNKSPFHPVSFLSRVAKDEVVTIGATLLNKNTTARTVELTWVTSKWDGILASHEAKRETQKITLKPGESKQITYTPPALPTSVTFVQAEVKDGDTKSLIAVRFARDGFDEVRINFPAVTSYPLQSGAETTLFSCVHSTSQSPVDNNTLTLTLKDAVGKVLHTYTYTGAITSAMMGVKDSFVPTQTSVRFTLTARLEHAGELVDEVTMNYDCATIDSKLCQAPTNTMKTVLYVGIALLVLALLGIGGWHVMRKRERSVTIGENDTILP